MLLQHARNLSDVVYAASQCGHACRPRGGCPIMSSSENSIVQLWRLGTQVEIAARAQFVRMKRLCSAMDTSADVCTCRTSLVGRVGRLSVF
jgi:hypothetical protein